MKELKRESSRERREGLRERAQEKESSREREPKRKRAQEKELKRKTQENAQERQVGGAIPCRGLLDIGAY